MYTIICTGKIIMGDEERFALILEELKDGGARSDLDIDIYISSRGGDGHTARAICNTMIKAQLFMATGGKRVDSAAMIIFMGAAYRLCHRNTTMLLHYMSPSDDGLDRAEASRGLVKFLSGMSKMEPAVVDKLMKEDTRLDAERAGRYEIVQEIIDSDAEV